MKRFWQWICSFSAIARGPCLRLEPYDKRFPTTAKESLFAFPWGLTVALSFGQWVRPIPRLAFSKPFPWVRLWGNPWTTESARWFVLRSVIPLPGLFVSFVTPGNRGFYLGCKLYRVNKSDGNPRYNWAGSRENKNVYQCPSGSIRHTAVD